MLVLRVQGWIAMIVGRALFAVILASHGLCVLLMKHLRAHLSSHAAALVLQVDPPQ